MATASTFTTPLPTFTSSPRRRTSTTLRSPSQISAISNTSIGQRSTTTASHYEILGIQTSATCQEIKQAYRKLARVSHPDVVAAASGADEFMRIHSAYATLSDPEKRADYDRMVVGKRRGMDTVSYGYVRGGDTTAFGCRRWETDQCW